ncbi:zinc dependent phospholipase C family protein [Alloacidobacterium dinghuense]|uniref:zinc dependent phospholipase C family protein n=1 Tax=Alloacidobacterium dinghuense TaxID=2763107 RepID=UPI002036EEEF|nr:zinc dependent phospholipase C family protein [Alloacidobacterium dinghuense]
MFRLSLLIWTLIVISCPYAFAYAVLTHQQMIDLAWGPSIKPLLLARYPQTTAEQLRIAQSYAYGGCEIQDAGYYPFSHVIFSDLLHYVRTGDFIASLIRNARNANELAFALGALSHYVGDSIGHQDAVNPSTAVEFPKLALQYGHSITYDESPHGHVRTEFAFDIDQMTKEHFAPQAYLNHIGLRVSGGLLERAFYETYGLHLYEVLGKKRRGAAIGSYRRSVRAFLPDVAHAEALIHRKDFPPDPDTEEFQRFSQRINEADYNHGWQDTRRKAGIKTHFLAFFVIIVPKVGTLSDLSIKIPTEETESKYVASVNRSLDWYNDLLKRLLQAPSGDPKMTMNLDNRDLDTGYIVQPGGYPLTDKTYAKLLGLITAKPTEPAPSGLKRDILAYYSNPNSPIITKKDAKAWKNVQGELAVLEAMPVVPMK